MPRYADMGVRGAWRTLGAAMLLVLLVALYEAMLDLAWPLYVLAHFRCRHPMHCSCLDRLSLVGRHRATPLNLAVPRATFVSDSSANRRAPSTWQVGRVRIRDAALHDVSRCDLCDGGAAQTAGEHTR